MIEPVKEKALLIIVDNGTNPLEENEGEDTEGQPAPKKHKYTKKPKERGAVPAESVNTPAVTEQRDDGVQV